MTIMFLSFLIIFFLLFKKNEYMNETKPETENNEPVLNLSDYEKTLLTKINSKFYLYWKQYKTTPIEVFYALLWNETSTQIYNNVPNEKIIGDNGLSLGYMQVNHKGGLIDFNNRENKDYTKQDLLDEKINIEVGLTYLGYCYNSAKNQTSNQIDQNYLTLKKYNGGLDETLTSKNKGATNYATNGIERIEKIKEFLGIKNA